MVKSNAYRIVEGKPKGIRKPTRMFENNIKVDRREIG
jgi:hypothetical protein